MTSLRHTIYVIAFLVSSTSLETHAMTQHEQNLETEIATITRSFVSSIIGGIGAYATYTQLHYYYGWYINAALYSMLHQSGKDDVASEYIDLYRGYKTCVTDATWHQQLLGTIMIMEIPFSYALSHITSYTALRELCRHFEIAEYDPSIPKEQDYREFTLVREQDILTQEELDLFDWDPTEDE